MKRQLFLTSFLCITASSVSAGAATVIQSPDLVQVNGVLDGGLIAPDDVGNTLDYLKFEVLSTTQITVTSGFSGGLLLMLAEYIGRDDQFGFIDNPFRLEQTSSTEWSTLTRSLDPGIYIAAMGVRDDTSYDIFDGFTAVNPEGGGFTWADYAYSIAGDVRALEFWDGELDGTFIITIIPEPSAAMFLIAASLFGASRRTPLRRNV
jgi:hypothetical protein